MAIGIVAQFPLGSLLGHQTCSNSQFTYDSANVAATLMSQASDFPPCNGVSVNPSDRLLSRQLRPDGATEAKTWLSVTAQ